MKRDDDEDLHTLLAFRLSEKSAGKWRDVFLLVSFTFIFLFGASVIGALQYFVLCKPKYPTATFQECFSFDMKPAPRR